MAGAVAVTWNGEEILSRAKAVFAEHGKACMERSITIAKKNSPLLTGHNRRGITGDFFEGGLETDRHSGEEAPSAMGEPAHKQPDDLQSMSEGFRIYTQSGYGGYLETGTTKMAARPYIYPAVVDAVNSFSDSLEGAMK